MNNSASSHAESTQGARDPLLFSVLHTAEVLQGRLDAALAEVGLSMAKHGLLDVLVQSGEPLTLGELAARISCVRSNVTQLVDRLESEGLVVRVDDPADRRVVRAAVTSAGADRHSAGSAALERVQAELTSTLPPADRDALKQLLSRLV